MQLPLLAFLVARAHHTLHKWASNLAQLSE
jgi:hypothetical protein